MSISLIIPFLDCDPGKKEILERCINSFEGQYDELIVVDDPDKMLPEKINIGLKKAKGDFMVVSNDDVYLRSGSLRDLCHVGEVHSPVVHGGYDKLFHAHMFCVPRDVYEKVGGYDETCPSNYYCDSDYWVRLLKAEVPVIKNESIHIDHPEPARTLKSQANKERDGLQWFIDKHGASYLAVVQ